MTSQYDRLRLATNVILATIEPLTQQAIRDEIARLRPAFPEVTDAEAERLAAHFERLHAIEMGSGHTLRGASYEPWLDRARQDIDPYYWGRYEQHLRQQEFPRKVVSQLHRVTDRIVGLLQNPRREGPWDRRGMVVGHVQSGKTANYVGVACKAADAGYRVIIVIAGIHNNLRQQTQQRVDAGLIGVDTSQGLAENRVGRTVGVGRYDSSRRPAAFTHATRDFNRATADGVNIPLKDLKEPAVFVIKKNAHTLRNLLRWLQVHNRRHNTSRIKEPLLIIDDEADNASINIKKYRDEVSTINSLIRDLLSLFERSCYVGYTATPFANIFIDPDDEDEMVGHDLFPSDFIVSLDPPDDYVGPAAVFGDDAVPMIRHIEDNADLLPLRHNKDWQVYDLPQSLKAATRSFLLARTIRVLGGQEKAHHSMLVNASRFVRVQGQLRDLLHEFVDGIRRALSVHGGKAAATADRSPEIRALRGVFETEYGTCAVQWGDVLRGLFESASATDVLVVNSTSRDALDYRTYTEGRSVIAVGGFSLSRGLTLEGLVVSYFLRNSMMYDTLMQMGRWFGYRRGYEDLCRIWMAVEAEEWYAHIAEAMEELREDLVSMEQEGATPRDFGLRVRSHPTSLIVTARNKMGTGQHVPVSVGLANSLIETTWLTRSGEAQHVNRQTARALVDSLTRTAVEPTEKPPYGGHGRLYRNVSVDLVLDFIQAFQNDPASSRTAREPVMAYIAGGRRAELALWDVFFPSVNPDGSGVTVDRTLGFGVGCQERSIGKPPDGSGRRRNITNSMMVTSRQRVGSRGMERVGLSEDQVREAEAACDEERRRKGQEPTSNYSDRIYRATRDRPLLVVHLLALKEDGEVLSDPVVAYSISFPKTDREQRTVEYMVNTVWYQEQFGAESDEETTGNDA